MAPLDRCSTILALFVLFAAACDPGFPVVEREDGDRTPLGLSCDPIDPGRCLLPWPSNAYVRADASRATGLRVELDASSLSWRDDPSSLARADGFSRVSPLLTYFDAPLDETTALGAVRLVLAQHDHPDRGHEVLLRVETRSLPDGRTLLLAHPREVLEPAADYVVVVTDALRHADGSAPAATPATQVALGVVAPTSEEEARLAGYHAPTRRTLARMGIDPARVIRAWDFTTRSAEDPRRALRHVREAAIAAVDAGEVGVTIDRVQTSDDPNIAAIVIGRVTGLPTFLDEDLHFVSGNDGLPTVQGTRDAPFRVLLPAGEGSYRFVMYGHGTGGSELDTAFDAQLAERGIAKVGVRLYGWTDQDVPVTFIGLQRAIDGSHAAAAQLVQALAHAAAIQRAMVGVLADALSAPMLGESANPAAGRRPDGSIPIWVGGSLGGTTGLIYGAADPNVRYAIINVPGAAWSQWVWQSVTFDLIHDGLLVAYQDDIDLSLALTIGQTNLDLADGSAWSDVLRDEPTAFLIQESMGDPVLPNAGTEMVAVTVGARHVGGVLQAIPGIEPAAEVIDGSAITQYRTAEEGIFEVHGFAGRDAPAGRAAREQILDFLESAWSGASRIRPPSMCPAAGCDFSAP
jgi:hypothetical protein